MQDKDVIVEKYQKKIKRIFFQVWEDTLGNNV